ncbi:bud neck involved protein [Aspergillus hancockii]|nr:bud neck involved protein [Aspergillus hancockii]
MNISSPTVARPSPDRYRRGTRRPDGAGASQPATTTSSTPGSARAPLGTTDDHHSQLNPASGSKGPVQDTSRKLSHNRAPSADDSSRTEKPQPELAKRYRRRSWGHTEPAPSSNKVAGKPDDTKRVPKPSPLSQPVTQDPKPQKHQVAAPAQPQPKEKRAPTDSVATQRLAEITNNDFKRPGKSRLRRAFSFGSASELLKASAQSSANKKEAIAVEQARRDLLKQELGPEQAAIAEQQEASGLGESIYSHHQGRFFNSSTDNLSVSSTASSASIMLRKMGKGMKRSTRSLVGLFRPKSIMSTTSNDGIVVEPMAPQLSVVNIEAERKSVAVNPDPQDVPRGGTVFPRVEPAAQNTSTPEDSTAEPPQARKSIMGGDKERAEVLAAVRKGILKKTPSDPANSTPNKQAEGAQTINRNDSPHSSAPSTPEDQSRSDRRRSDAVRIAGEDDFLSEGRFLDSKGVSITQPLASKSLVFSPRIQFHDTWPSGEYDRRGEIATCNRLTPLLAQQIKEELNNFKMEMEVHETSKIYTHFL